MKTSIRTEPGVKEEHVEGRRSKRFAKKGKSGKKRLTPGEGVKGERAKKRQVSF